MNNKIYVTRSSLPPFEEYVEMIKPLWESVQLTNNGKYHNELEKALKEYLNVPEVSLLTNGHIALELAIEAWGLSGEVITTPFTFVSTVHAMVRKGLKPVFCDIRPDTYAIDTEKIEERITDRTSAIFVVHPYGHICDVEEIQRIADTYNLKVIYDAAHTFGETYKARSVASYGDVSVLSFHATKAYHTVEGGAIAYNNKNIKSIIDGLKNFGIRSEEMIDMVGGNAKMDELRAAMGICNLRHITDEINKRQKVADKYTELLDGIEGIKLPSKQKDVISNYAYYPVLFEEEKLGCNRDDLYNLLREAEIYARKYFHPLISDTDCYKDAYSSDETPTAAYVAKNILAMPIYADLPLEEVEKICRIVKNKIR